MSNCRSAASRSPNLDSQRARELRSLGAASIIKSAVAIFFRPSASSPDFCSAQPHS